MASYEPGALAVAGRQGSAIVHAGGEAVVADLTGAAGEGLHIEDDGQRAALRWGEGQLVELQRKAIVDADALGPADLSSLGDVFKTS